MEFTHILFLALLQGLTEFLPISSSAHLLLVPVLFDWPDQGLAFDVALHVGTLTAVLLYFRKDLARIVVDFSRSVHSGQRVGDSRLGWAVLFGTVPVGVGGLLVGKLDPELLRSPVVVAWASIGFGLALWLAEALGAKQRDESQLQWRDIIWVGFAQALALIPGTSRSGATITAGLALGLTARAAARFSFLLSIPVIMLAGGYIAEKAWVLGAQVDWRAMYLGAVISALSAYVCIHLFLKMLERIGMWPFVIYRIMLGAALLWVFG